MNVLFVGRSVFHFSYYEKIIIQLLLRGHSVEVLFDETWSSNQPDRALKNFISASPARFNWGWAVRRGGSLRNLVFVMRELRSYASYLRRPDQSDFYLKRWESYLPASIRSLLDRKLFRLLLKKNWVDKIFLLSEQLAPASALIIKDIARASPDVIIASPGNMRFDEEIEYIKAGRKLGIPTAIMTLSWDNLSTKGLFHVHPDLLLCWNDVHRNEAVELHRIRVHRVLEIGSPFFDKWFEATDFHQDRKEFCARVGLDPRRPYFLYLGSSSNIAPDETWLIDELILAMRNSPDPCIETAQLLIRPHPANAQNYLRFETVPNVVVWPQLGALPESENAQSEFFNTVKHSVAAVGINTSGMIDNIIIGRPCVALVIERYAKTQQQAIHFSYICNSGAVEIANSSAACVKVFAELLRHNDKKRGARRVFVRRYVRPHGIGLSAGALGTTALEILVRRGSWSAQAKKEFLATISEDTDATDRTCI